MPPKPNTGIKRIIKATQYSSKGLRAAFQHEAAFRQEIWLALVMIPVAFFVDVEQWQRVLMVCSVLLVMVVELLNTAIEAVVDRIGPEFHELAGRAKDTGSAAVMITMFITGYIWVEALFLS